MALFACLPQAGPSDQLLLSQTKTALENSRAVSQTKLPHLLLVVHRYVMNVLSRFILAVKRRCPRLAVLGHHGRYRYENFPVLLHGHSTVVLIIPLPRSHTAKGKPLRRSVFPIESRREVRLGRFSSSVYSFGVHCVALFIHLNGERIALRHRARVIF